MARQSLTLGFFCVRHGHGFAVLNGPRSLRFSIWAVRRACFGYGGAGYVRIVASALVLNYFNCD